MRRINGKWKYTDREWRILERRVFGPRGVSREVAEARPYFPYARGHAEVVYANHGDISDGKQLVEVRKAYTVKVKRKAYTRKDGRRVKGKTYERKVKERVKIIDRWAGGDFGHIPPKQRNAVYGKIVRQSRGLKMMKHRVPLKGLSEILPQLRPTRKDVYLEIQKVHRHDGMEHTAGGCVCGADHDEGWTQQPLTKRELKQHVNGKKHRGKDTDRIHPNVSTVPYAFSPLPYVDTEEHRHNPRTSEGHLVTLHKDDAEPVGDKMHEHPTGYSHRHKPDTRASHVNKKKGGRLEHEPEWTVLQWVVVPKKDPLIRRFPGAAKYMKRPFLEGLRKQLGPWHFHPEPKKDRTKESYDKRLDLHPFSRDRLADAEVVYFALEGVLKADSITTAGGCAFDVPSVTLWDARELTDFALEHIDGKTVVVVPDSDWSSNPAVSLEAFSARRFLKQRRFGIREVFVAAPTPKPECGSDVCRHGPDGTPDPDHKRGIDDALADPTYGLGDLLVVGRRQSRAMTRWCKRLLKEQTGANAPKAIRLNPRTAKRMLELLQWLALVADEDGRVHMRASSIGKYFVCDRHSVKEWVDRLAERPSLWERGWRDPRVPKTTETDWFKSWRLPSRWGHGPRPLHVDKLLVWEANYVTGVEEWREMPVITIHPDLRARTRRHRLGDILSAEQLGTT